MVSAGGSEGRMNWQGIQSGQNKGGLKPGGKHQQGFSSLTQEVRSGGW